MQVNFIDSYIRPTELGDAVELHCNLREQDNEECLGLGVFPFMACTQSAIPGDRNYTLRKNGTDELVACFGVGDTDCDGEGCIWMLGTPLVKSVSNTFLRYSRDWVSYLVEGYQYVSNIVSMNNFISVRWLQWVGAVFGHEVTPGYLQFTIPNPRK